MADTDIKITVDTAALRSKASEVINKRNQLEGLMRSMQNYVDSLKNSFNSEAGNTYISNYKNVTNNIQGALQALTVQVNHLNMAADMYDQESGRHMDIVNENGPESMFE